MTFLKNLAYPIRRDNTSYLSLKIFQECTMPTIENYATKKLTANNEIMMYLNDNELSVSPDSLGLVYIPLKEGNSVFPKENDIVAFHYIGYYLNGEVFDSSYDKSRPLIVQLGENQMIKGLEYSLLKKLFSNAIVMLCGDFFQTIYEWRGSNTWIHGRW